MAGPDTVPAIAGGIGVRFAVADGGCGNFGGGSLGSGPGAAGGGLPGPTTFGFALPRIKFCLLPLAVERVIAGRRGAAGGGQAVARDVADPRGRRRVGIAQPVVDAVAAVVGGGLRGIGAGLARGQILRRHKAVAHRAQQVAGQDLRPGVGDLRERSARGMAKTRVKRLHACGGPLLDPTSRQKILQRNQIHADEFHSGANAPRKIVVNGVKTIMVNEPLRARPRVASLSRPC